MVEITVFRRQRRWSSNCKPRCKEVFLHILGQRLGCSTASFTRFVVSVGDHRRGGQPSSWPNDAINFANANQLNLSQCAIMRFLHGVAARKQQLPLPLLIMCHKLINNQPKLIASKFQSKTFFKWIIFSESTTGVFNQTERWHLRMWGNSLVPPIFGSFLKVERRHKPSAPQRAPPFAVVAKSGDRSDRKRLLA